MTLTLLLSVIISGIITNNIVLVQSLGICPFLGVSKSWIPGWEWALRLRSSS